MHDKCPRLCFARGVLVAAMASGAAAWWKQDWLKEETYALRERDRRCTTAQERALKAGDPFKECRDCPEMIVVPARTLQDGLARRSRR